MWKQKGLCSSGSVPGHVLSECEGWRDEESLARDQYVEATS